MKIELAKRILFYISIPFIALLMWLVVIDWNVFYLFGKSPSFKEVRHPKLAVASEIYTADSVLIGRFYKQNRTPVDFADLPENLVSCLIATEDVRFYRHKGIDLYSLFSSMWSTAQGEKRGGSTLTQQLAKNLYGTRTQQSRGVFGKIPGVSTLVAKAKEWNTALKLEYVYSKQELIALYLNTVSFGNNTYGIKVASRKYFNKEPKKLTVTESALLIGMLKAVSTYNPFQNPEAALERRNVVLNQMQKYGFVEKEKLPELLGTPLGLDPGDADAEEDKDSYLRGAVAWFLSDWCKKNQVDLYQDGLKIYTTIDSRLQNHAENAVKEQMVILQRRFNNHWGGQNPWRDEHNREIPNYLETKAGKTSTYLEAEKLFGDRKKAIDSMLKVRHPMKVFTWRGATDTVFSIMDSLRYYASLLHSGMLSIEPSTGKIKVWIGGNNHQFFKYDNVYMTRRQPGSTFKPFAYLAALDMGYSPCDKFYDQPVTIRYTENGEKKTWSPHNADWVFTGNHMSLRWAMGKSCNSVTAQLTEQIGWDTVISYAHRMGIASPLARVPSICLGTSDVNLYEMVSAYSTFLNHGNRCKPLLVTHITDHDGKPVAEFKPEPIPTISDETAFLMLHMFKGGIQEPGGTSQALWEYDLFRNNNDIGGKTGTSSKHSDGWYIGLTKDLVTGVWVGADEPSIHFRTGETGEGSKTALPIFGKFMEACYHDPKSGITYGKFPAPHVKIKRTYNCPTPWVKPETDSTAEVIPEEEAPAEEVPVLLGN